MENEHFCENHSKYLLQYHLILTVKYRKPLLIKYGNDVKNKIINISKTSRFEIIEMEVDTDHIHILVSTKPNISPSQIIRSIKGQTTQDLWDTHPLELRNEFWKKKKNNVFWSPSYFICSIGNASKEVIEQYIKNQG